MRVSQFLSVVAMPLAAAMPAATQHHARQAGRVLYDRATMMDASQFNFDPFNLTNIGMDCSRSTADELYSCELRFDWHDPNSVRENNLTSCSCLSKWSWDGVTPDSGEKNTYSSSFSICRIQLPTYFEMRFDGFNSSQDFRLEIAHHYKDSENFTAPWVYPTTFAQPVFHLPLIERNNNSIRLYDSGPVYAKIVGIAD